MSSNLELALSYLYIASFTRASPNLASKLPSLESASLPDLFLLGRELSTKSASYILVSTKFRSPSHSVGSAWAVNGSKSELAKSTFNILLIVFIFFFFLNLTVFSCSCCISHYLSGCRCQRTPTPAFRPRGLDLYSPPMPQKTRPTGRTLHHPTCPNLALPRFWRSRFS